MREMETERARERGEKERGRRHVVAEAAVLVVGDEEERASPAGTGTQSLVHLLDEALAFAHRGVWVLPGRK